MLNNSFIKKLSIFKAVRLFIFERNAIILAGEARKKCIIIKTKTKHIISINIEGNILLKKA